AARLSCGCGNGRDRARRARSDHADEPRRQHHRPARLVRDRADPRAEPAPGGRRSGLDRDERSRNLRPACARRRRRRTAVAKSSRRSLTFRPGTSLIMRRRQGIVTMSANKNDSVSAMQHRINAEIQDNFDEDLELELEDSELADLLAEGHELPERLAFPRRLYFTELLRLQRELIKLQDWVVAKKLKLVVIFEGRDSAGKGGAIKRVTQRLNPRVCRAVALSAPSERERSQWYFQRYVPHLPAGGEI